MPFEMVWVARSWKKRVGLQRARLEGSKVVHVTSHLPWAGRFGVSARSNFYDYFKICCKAKTCQEIILKFSSFLHFYKTMRRNDNHKNKTWKKLRRTKWKINQVSKMFKTTRGGGEKERRRGSRTWSSFLLQKELKLKRMFQPPPPPTPSRSISSVFLTLFELVISCLFFLPPFCLGLFSVRCFWLLFLFVFFCASCSYSQKQFQTEN